MTSMMKMKKKSAPEIFGIASPKEKVLLSEQIQHVIEINCLPDMQLIFGTGHIIE